MSAREQPERIRGSCLCGAVAYEIEGELSDLVHCHCSMCRKIHGAAFGTYASVPRGAFRFVRGEAKLASYRSSGPITRTFCGTCGSTLQFIRDGRATLSIAVGTLDTDPGRRATRHIWTKDKAPWWHITDDLPRYEGAEPR
jgi:hypothetical protein